jgi:hypothetical protein
MTRRDDVDRRKDDIEEGKGKTRHQLNDANLTRPKNKENPYG